jgi:uncharacterized membrane protein YobD (UPF0266 family)
MVKGRTSSLSDQHNKCIVFQVSLLLFKQAVHNTYTYILVAIYVLYISNSSVKVSVRATQNYLSAVVCLTTPSAFFLWPVIIYSSTGY